MCNRYWMSYQKTPKYVFLTWLTDADHSSWLLRDLKPTLGFHAIQGAYLYGVYHLEKDILYYTHCGKVYWENRFKRIIVEVYPTLVQNVHEFVRTCCKIRRTSKMNVNETCTNHNSLKLFLAVAYRCRSQEKNLNCD